MDKISALQREVLNRLIDIYERRSDYGINNKNPRRTMLKVNKKTYPGYYHVSDSSFRLMFNDEMAALAQEKLVELQWQRFSEGENLEKIILSEPSLNPIYILLNRATKKEIYGETINIIREIRADASSGAFFFYDLLIENLNSLQSLPAPLRVDKRDDLIDTLYGLNALLVSRDEEISKRVLSIKLYKDSKRWRQLERNILQIYRNFFQSHNQTTSEGATGELNDAEMEAESSEILWMEGENAAILSEAGIADNPSHIRLSGHLILKGKEKEIDLSLFSPDIGLPSLMAQRLEIVLCKAEKIIVIENLTTFYQYLKEKQPTEIVIYSGGFTGRGLRVLLQKIHFFAEENNIDMSFLFWGDIDLGGFRIWQHIREKTGISFMPFMMDAETYLKHLHLGHYVTEKYLEKLRRLLQKEELKTFHPVINLMLKNKIRVEQEAISLQSTGK